jgi:hypothetical protein
MLTSWFHQRAKALGFFKRSLGNQIIKSGPHASTFKHMGLFSFDNVKKHDLILFAAFCFRFTAFSGVIKGPGSLIRGVRAMAKHHIRAEQTDSCSPDPNSNFIFFNILHTFP